MWCGNVDNEVNNLSSIKQAWLMWKKPLTLIIQASHKYQKYKHGSWRKETDAVPWRSQHVLHKKLSVSSLFGLFSDIHHCAADCFILRPHTTCLENSGPHNKLWLQPQPFFFKKDGDAVLLSLLATLEGRSQLNLFLGRLIF